MQPLPHNYVVTAKAQQTGNIALGHAGAPELETNAPPNFGGGFRDAWTLLKAGNLFRKLSKRHQIVLAELMTRSLGDYLDMWFEGEALKGVLGLEGVIGNFAEPYQAGTAYVLLHHAFGEVKGRAGAWGIARGGMGAISESMASFARSTSGPIASRIRRALRNWPA